jgi:hypothetical protein
MCGLATSCRTAITRSGKFSFFFYLGNLKAQQQSPAEVRTAERALNGAAVADVVIIKMITSGERAPVEGKAHVLHRE